MHRGTIKWFNARDRYGFIVPESGDGDDVFVSENLLARLSIVELSAGQQVRYDAVPSRKGLRAVALTIL